MPAVSQSKNWNGPDCVAISRSFVGLAAPFDYLGFLSCWRLRRRTPGPPPFSSMNSTPAAQTPVSSTARVAYGIPLRPAQVPDRSSPQCCAASRKFLLTVQSSGPRAALHCEGVIIDHEGPNWAKLGQFDCFFNDFLTLMFYIFQAY